MSDEKKTQGKSSNGEPTDFEPWPAPDWKDVPTSLETVRVYAESVIENEIAWYRKASVGTRRFSRLFRAIALLFTTLGGLVPVLKSAGVFDLPQFQGQVLPLDIGQLGYVFLAIAAGVAVFDRFFGYSTAWMRYISAQCALERVRDLFRLEWTAISRLPTANPGDDAVGRLLETAKRYVVKAKELTERDIEAWVMEFRANLAQLEKDLRAQVEATRPGAIDVKLKDGTKATAGIEVRLNQLVVEHVTGSTASVAQVTPGLHKISAAATVQGKSYLASQMVNVLPAEVTPIELELGIP